jgi:hypothetical protein
MQKLSIFLIFSCLPGCLAFGYPRVTYTPQVASLPSDVHAFKSTLSFGGKSIVMTGGESISGTIEEIPIVDGRLDSLDHSYFSYFIGGIPVAFFKEHDWKIILYRPGYEIIEIPSRWYVRKFFASQIDQLAWKPAKSIEAQLAALKLICPEGGFSTPSPEIRRFVDQERERLAGLMMPETFWKSEQ